MAGGPDFMRAGASCDAASRTRTADQVRSSAAAAIRRARGSRIEGKSTRCGLFLFFLLLPEAEAEQDRAAAAELRRAVFLSPYEAEAQLLLGRIDLRGGRPQDAVAALKISIWSRDTAPARIALADAYLRLKDTASAKEHAQKAIALDPQSAEAAALLKRIEGG